MCYGAGDSHVTLVGVDAVEQGFRGHPLDWQAALGDKQQQVRTPWTSPTSARELLQKDTVASRDQQYQTAGLLKEGEDVELHTKLVDPSLGL